MLIRIFSAAILLLVTSVCHAAVVFHPVFLAASLQCNVGASGYNSSYYALRFVNRTEALAVDTVAHEFCTVLMKPDCLVAGNTTQAMLEKLTEGWKKVVKAGRGTEEASDVLPSEFRAWVMSGTGALSKNYTSGMICVVDNLDALKSIGLAQLDAGARVGWIINVSSDAARPQWVAVGIFKWGADYHVCTMDPVAGSSVFSDTAGGPRTPVERAIATALVPPTPTVVSLPPPVHASRAVSPVPLPMSSPKAGSRRSSGSGSVDSLEGFGGAGDVASGDGRSGSPLVLDDGTVYDSRAFGEDVNPGWGGDDDADFWAMLAGRIHQWGAAAAPVVQADLQEDYEDGDSGAPAGEEGQCGLVNQGSSCYQNSVLQAIHKSEILRAQLTTQLSIRPVDPYLDLPIRQMVVGFAHVFTQLSWCDRTYYDPVVFAHRVFRHIFQGSQGQQDAQEFLSGMWLFLQQAGFLPDSTPAHDAVIAAAEQAELNRWYGVHVGRNLRCTVCGTARNMVGLERSYTLALEIPDAGPVMFNQLLTNFTTPGIVPADSPDAIRCENCAVGVDGQALKTAHIAQHAFNIKPEMQYVVVQLKRFRYVAGGQKCLTPVTFPDPNEAGDVIVTINDSQGTPHQFRVASVVVHRGGFGGGHYWAVGPDGKYNDSNVTLDGGEAMRELLATGLDDGDGTPYLYFLERVGVVAPAVDGEDE
jgi:ubiquitin C-terminal hydrolase